MVLHSPLTLWDRDNMLHQGYEAGKIGLVQDSIGDAVKMAEDMGDYHRSRKYSGYRPHVARPPDRNTWIRPRPDLD